MLHCCVTTRVFVGSYRTACTTSYVRAREVQRIPLTEGDRPTASPMLLRQVLIALMPGLMRLNASEVNSKDPIHVQGGGVVWNKDWCSGSYDEGR